MISIKNLSFAFPDKELYDDVSFSIERGQSLAFIGSSGSGKSTLAEIILDDDKYMYDGKIEREDSYKIGFVSQFYDVDLSKEITVFEYIAQDFVALEAKIHGLCEEMGTTDDLDEVMEEYQKALDKSEAIDGDNYENNINKKLNLANLFQQKDLDISKLSGGEYKLIQVIKQMLTTPHFVIMDEPDAFLDFDNLKALRNLINSYKGTMLTITHSRYLLNHCFNKILHLENKKIQEFEGNYIDYNFELLATKVELQELACRDTEEIERNKIMIDKLRTIATHHDAAANGRSLHARVTYAHRLEARRIKDPYICVEQPEIILKAENVKAEETVLRVSDLDIAFEEVLMKDVNFEIKGTDKVAVIGANGTGKTSLIREIYKNSNPSITYGEDVTVSYLSQNQGEMFEENSSIYDAFFDLGFQTYDEISSYLLKFGFPEEKMNQKISSLSGGEKNILGLAKISNQSSNFLILDEPISHLDTYSQIALEESIRNYNGALLMISHDFYSIVNCADYVLIIENQTVRKMQMRKFRKMIYASHFDKDYLQLEQSKKELETKIEQALDKKDFESAKVLVEGLEEIITGMKN
ncbi:MAG: ATP-binding cassette domain-containing protein [Eubacteriales bacterium]